MLEFCKLLGSVPHGHRHWEVSLQCFSPLSPSLLHCQADMQVAQHMWVLLCPRQAQGELLFETHEFYLNYNLITHYCIALLWEKSLLEYLLEFY